MKKLFTLIVALFLTFNLIYADGGWASSAVSITKDAGTAYLYLLNNESWTDGTWGSNTAFDNYNFGTPTSLILNGGDGNGWTSDSPGYDATSFVIYYRVYQNGVTPGGWLSVALDNLSYSSGNNKIYNKTNAGIDLRALATVTGTNTYTVEVLMTKNQFYTGGNWNSMVPGGQNLAYNSATAGYKATFTKSISTGISKIESSLQISTESGKVTARFDGKADVQLFTSTGQLISATSAENEFSKTVKSGVYLLHIAGKSHKVVVQ
jgi:hypothetical protein